MAVTARLPPCWSPAGRLRQARPPVARRRGSPSARAGGALQVSSELQIFRSDDIELERRVGSVGIMSISSYSPQAGSMDGGLDSLSLAQMGGQQAQEDGITANLWAGRIRRGESAGARVILKAYPAQMVGMDFTADTLAANELAAHSALQPPVVAEECPQIAKLMGGFVSSLGGTVTEQWLVFRNDGLITAGQYATRAAEAGAKGQALGEGEFWDNFDKTKPIRRRKIFILKCLREALTGLTFMHSKNRLHQSLGPNSLVLSTQEERDAYTLRVRLQDLAFAVDVSPEAMYGGATLAEIWERGNTGAEADPKQSLAEPLWRRARAEEAWTEEEKRNFGVADDIYAAGLLLAYMALVPLSDPGSIDAGAIQRLFETTFQLDIDAAQEYCEADERWQEGVKFLDGGNGAGWDLLKAMLSKNWRNRPTAESCLNHPFLKGEGLE